MERSPLIRHPSLAGWSGAEQEDCTAATLTQDTQQFLKEVVDLVKAGDGVGWLKLRDHTNINA